MRAEFGGSEARRKKHILLLDDDAVFGRALGRLLGQVGYRVTVADNATEALSTHRERPADLVITDTAMRKGEALDVLKELRHDAATPKIIAISGGRDDHLRQARRLGARYTFRKPFVTEEVLEAIDEELGTG